MKYVIMLIRMSSTERKPYFSHEVGDHAEFGPDELLLVRLLHLGHLVGADRLVHQLHVQPHPLLGQVIRARLYREKCII